LIRVVVCSIKSISVSVAACSGVARAIAKNTPSLVGDFGHHIIATIYALNELSNSAIGGRAGCAQKPAAFMSFTRQNEGQAPSNSTTPKHLRGKVTTRSSEVQRQSLRLPSGVASMQRLEQSQSAAAQDTASIRTAPLAAVGLRGNH
jgi:hypothetical protein